MTEGSMTGRPYGGTHDAPGDGPLPGERPATDEEREVGAETTSGPPRIGEGRSPRTGQAVRTPSSCCAMRPAATARSSAASSTSTSAGVRRL